MKISDFIQSDKVIKNTPFETTYSPDFKTNKSIAYAINQTIIDKLNKDQNVVGIIVLPSLVSFVDHKKGVVISENPQKTYYELHNHLVEKQLMPVVKGTFIDETAHIHKSAHISENVKIGKNVKIGIGVIIKENTIIDDNCIIGDYSVIGASGLQNTTIEGRNFLVKNGGGVHIHENCVIHTGCIIQKPYQAFFTTIKSNSKIANKSVIAHGVQIEENVMISGNSIISGNVRIGNSVWVGPGSVIRDGIIIGDHSKVRLGSVVISNIANNSDVSGNFARQHNKNLHNYVKQNR